MTFHDDLNYARSKFSAAVHTMAVSEDPLRQRLRAAWDAIHTISPRDFPEGSRVRSDFVQLDARMSWCEAKADEGMLSATLAVVSHDELQRLARLVIDVHDGILDALEEQATTRQHAADLALETMLGSHVDLDEWDVPLSERRGVRLMPSPSILRSAHGTAREHGATLVAETPRLDELGPPNVAPTEHAMVLAERPFAPSNMAAAGRGPAAERISDDDLHPDPKEERRRVRRGAASLKNARFLELEVQYGFRLPSSVSVQPDGTRKTVAGKRLPGTKLSSGVKVEIKAWALDTCWADHFDRAGDPLKASTLRERASGHQLKAIAVCEREAASRPRGRIDPLARWRLPTDGAPPLKEAGK